MGNVSECFRSISSTSGVIGFASVAGNAWVTKISYNQEAAAKGQYGTGVVQLTSLQDYYFCIVFGVADGGITATSTGGSGSGIGTYFSIKRIN